MVEGNQQRRDVKECAVYALPVHLLHALFLAIGVLAIARAAELIRPGRATFWLAGIASTAALLAESDLFSFVMTESLVFSLYSIFVLTLLAPGSPKRRHRACGFALAGVVLGILCLTRTAYVVLAPVAILLFLRKASFDGVACVARGRGAGTMRCRDARAVGAAQSKSPSANSPSAKNTALLSLIERFAFNRITAAEFALAAPYCLPVIGPPVVSAVAGAQAMSRFQWNAPGSFFETGRAKAPRTRQGTQAARSGDWPAHRSGNGARTGGDISPSASRSPGAACGPAASSRCCWCPPSPGPATKRCGVRRRYFCSIARRRWRCWRCTPALANHYTRYNLILIGPFAVAAAWFIQEFSGGRSARRRLRGRAS